MSIMFIAISATLINLAQNGIFYDNLAHKVSLPKMDKFFTIGNQIDRGTAVEFHVSHTACPVTKGGFGGLSPPKQSTQPPILKYESCKLVEFCQF